MRAPVCIVLAVSAVLIAAAPPATAKEAIPNHDPDAAKIVTSDLHNFVRAQELAKAATTTEEKERIFQTAYLDKGSFGLRDFLRLRIGSAKALVAQVDSHPKYYAALAGLVPEVASMEAAIRKSLHELKAIYPEAIFPDIYLLVGVLNSGGTTSDAGLLIGFEMHARTPTTDMSEMNAWLRTVLVPLEGLPGVVAHELVHYQQGPSGNTLLEQCIHEGSADFIGRLVSGQSSKGARAAYGDAHEKDLWREFSEAMNGKDFTRWLYQGDKSKDRPADLGYYMGDKIAQSYYDNASDKKKAVRDILTVRDYPAFLLASRYADKF
jgi:hypothetical protein